MPVLKGVIEVKRGNHRILSGAGVSILHILFQIKAAKVTKKQWQSLFFWLAEGHRFPGEIGHRPLKAGATRSSIHRLILKNLYDGKIEFLQIHRFGEVVDEPGI